MFENSSEASYRRILIYSLLLSLVTFIGVIWTNLAIAARFNASTGKTRALFGIIESTYSYKYFFAIGGVLATLLGVIAARRRQRQRWLAVVAIVLGLSSLALVLVRMWTLMVDNSA
jgi:hypothetical protein